jgi:hypothetical protein
MEISPLFHTQMSTSTRIAFALCGGCAGLSLIAIVAVALA